MGLFFNAPEPTGAALNLARIQICYKSCQKPVDRYLH